MSTAVRETGDTAALRKARGAFFTPPSIASFVASWAIRHASDRVLEPSTGDAEFLVHAIECLRRLGSPSPHIWGCELHAWSAKRAESRVADAGGRPHIAVGDFFDHEPDTRFDAVIGNPPYIRFQDFAGEQRVKARAAALRGGVSLTGLASSWAAFTVHSAMHLRKGGRLGFVLPAELLTSNYAAPVRRFVMEHFMEVDLVLFEERVFAEAETEAVLLLADGYGEGAADHITVKSVRNAAALSMSPTGTYWRPRTPDSKWSASTVDDSTMSLSEDLHTSGAFTALSSWGKTRLGMVTGRNTYFALAPSETAALGLASDETLPLSPPGSRHLRGLELSADDLRHLGAKGKRTRLFYPPDARPSDGALAYIARGEELGISEAYKCRTRRTWWQVPLMPPADLLLTCMNADTVRLTTNSCGALHLNSVHGVYLHEEVRSLGRELLPLASLNSATMLSAELTGRSYGGGILKMEPGEAAHWAMPAPSTVERAAETLAEIRGPVSDLLSDGYLSAAVSLVDETLLVKTLNIAPEVVQEIRSSRDTLALRRENRARVRVSAEDPAVLF